MKVKFPVLVTILAAMVVYADLADDLDDLVGYTIIASKTIERWHDDEEGDDSFNGCSHGRVIEFTDGSTLTCAEYGYQYVFRPTAVILAKQFTHEGKTFVDYKMVVGDDVYDMRL